MADDAAVWQVDDNTCVIATTDFFMPIVDDPRDFGRIAATNAISDVYAMGGKPILALAIVGMPINKLDSTTIAKILEGGASICAEAGIPVAGGHSIDSVEPIYGLAVIGLCHPSEVRRNGGVKAGDALILTKGIGVGIYSAAIKKNALPPGCYEEMIGSTTLLNRIGADLAADPDVHALTDVTGFGVLGHGLEMARASQLSLTLRLSAIPFLSQAYMLAEQGFITVPRGATGQATAPTLCFPTTSRTGSDCCLPTRRPRAVCWSHVRRKRLAHWLKRSASRVTRLRALSEPQQQARLRSR